MSFLYRFDVNFSVKIEVQKIPQILHGRQLISAIKQLTEYPEGLIGGVLLLSRGSSIRNVTVECI